MNKSAIIGLVVAGVLILGGGGWYLTRSTGNTGDNGDSSTASSIAEDIKDFVNPYNQSFKMTGTSSDSENPENNLTFTMEYQDKDTWAWTSDINGQKTQIIYDAGYNYMQNPGTDTWLRLPAGDNSSSPIDDFKITDKEMNDLKSKGISKGTSSCSLGTCETFVVTDPAGNGTTTWKVGKDGRIAEADFSSGTSSVHMVYDYNANVNIQIPTNYQDFSIPQ